MGTEERKRRGGPVRLSHQPIFELVGASSPRPFCGCLCLGRFVLFRDAFGWGTDLRTATTCLHENKVRRM